MHTSHQLTQMATESPYNSDFFQDAFATNHSNVSAIGGDELLSYKHFFIVSGMLFIISTSFLFCLHEKSPSLDGENCIYSSQIDNEQLNNGEQRRVLVSENNSINREVPEFRASRANDSEIVNNNVGQQRNNGVTCEPYERQEIMNGHPVQARELTISVKETYLAMFEFIKMPPILCYMLILFIVKVSMHSFHFNALTCLLFFLCNLFNS